MTISSDPRAVVLLFPGVEEIEFVTPVDILRRAGVQVTIVGWPDGAAVLGRSQIRLTPDLAWDDLPPAKWNAVVVPGGPGISRLRESTALQSWLRQQHDEGCLIAAICAAPTLLSAAGLLENVQFTGHFSTAGFYGAGQLRPEAVVEDGRILTSQGAGTALLFSLTLVSRLVSSQVAREVANSICGTQIWNGYDSAL